MPLMTALGKLAAKLVHAPVKLQVTYAGRTEGLDTRPLTRLLVASLLGPASGRVTPVNALHEAAQRGLEVAETLGGDGDGFDRLLRVVVEGQDSSGRPTRREIEATLHRGPRVVRLDGVELDFDPNAHILLMHNEDRPGVIGHVGTVLGRQSEGEAAAHGQATDHDLLAVGPQLLEGALHLGVPVRPAGPVELLPARPVAGQARHRHGVPLLGEVLGPGPHRGRRAGEAVAQQHADPAPAGAVGVALGHVGCGGRVQWHDGLLLLPGRCAWPASSHAGHGGATVCPADGR